jgi:hypothetical protein
MANNSPPGPLLTVRAALIFLIALAAGAAAATLTYLAGHSVPAAALAGGSTAGGATLLFNTIIGG